MSFFNFFSPSHNIMNKKENISLEDMPRKFWIEKQNINDMKYILTILMSQDEKWTKQISLSKTQVDEGPTIKENTCRYLIIAWNPPYHHVWHHKSYHTPWAEYMSQQIPQPQKQTSLTWKECTTVFPLQRGRHRCTAELPLLERNKLITELW